MNGYYEDIDEDLDELDSESDDEGLAEKRRRRRARPRGGDYRQRRSSAREAVSERDLDQALKNVGDDVKKLNANVATLERDAAASLRRLRSEQQNFAQMSMLLPLLLKGKPVEVKATDGTTAKVAAESDDTISLLLPMMMMSSMTGSSSGTADSGNSQGFMSGPMGMMFMLLLLDRDKEKSR